MSDPFSKLGGGKAAGTTKPKDSDGWSCVMPIPDGAPTPPDAIGNDRPSTRWAYGDAAGALLGFACRFDLPDGRKEFKPLTCWRRETDGQLRWRWATWPTPRPLYGLDRLAERLKAPVVVTEGEKAADVAARMLPAHVVVTSPNGSKSAAKADWSALAGRRVIVWPDADPAGAAYAEAVVSLVRDAGASFVAVLTPPEGVNEGWDAADAEAEGWTTARAEALVASARSAAVIDLEAARREKRAAGADKKKSGGSDDGESGGRRRRPAQRDQLAGLCGDIELWHDEAGDCYATIPVAGHRENWSLASKSFPPVAFGPFLRTDRPRPGRASPRRHHPRARGSVLFGGA